MARGPDPIARVLFFFGLAGFQSSQQEGSDPEIFSGLVGHSRRGIYSAARTV